MSNFVLWSSAGEHSFYDSIFEALRAQEEHGGNIYKLMKLSVYQVEKEEDKDV